MFFLLAVLCQFESFLRQQRLHHKLHLIPRGGSFRGRVDIETLGGKPARSANHLNVLDLICDSYQTFRRHVSHHESSAAGLGSEVHGTIGVVGLDLDRFKCGPCDYAFLGKKGHLEYDDAHSGDDALLYHELFLNKCVGESERLEARLRVGNIRGLAIRPDQHTKEIGL